MTGQSGPTLLDRAISYFAPEAGARRLVARMNFDAASRGLRLRDAKGPTTSPDAAGYGSRNLVRYRARDLVRNAPYATRGVAVIVNQTVGSGVLPSVPDSVDDAARRDMGRIIDEHLLTPALDTYGVCGLAEIQRQAMAAVVTDGEVLIRRRVRLTRDGFVLPLQIQMMEMDYLDTSRTRFGGNDVVEGVEYDDWGRAVAYHLYRRHPGAVNRRIDRTTLRVPASEIIHLRRIDRPGQMRGVSWLAPVLVAMKEVRDYKEAQLRKQKLAALVTGFLKKSQDPVGGGAANDPSEAIAGPIQPGTIMQLGPGEEPVFADAPKVDGHDMFTRVTLAEIAVGLGITYEALAGDLSGVNFSSARMGAQHMNRNVEVWQKQILIGQMCAGLNRWIAEVAPLAGLTWAEPHWTAPVPTLVDPAREVRPMIELIEAGLASRTGTMRRLGQDPARVTAEINAEGPLVSGEGLAGDIGAYGIAVRAGTVTPQIEDEESFRARMNLPPLSGDGRALWSEQNNVRQPVTLQGQSGSHVPPQSNSIAQEDDE